MAEIRHCYNYHRGLRSSPAEILHSKHPLNPNKEKTTAEIKDLLQHNQEERIKELKQENKHRDCRKEYKIGDMVYARSHKQGKMKPLWSGPYRIEEIQRNRMTVILSNNKHSVRTNIRHIRPL